jgi:hypothetical protein
MSGDNKPESIHLEIPSGKAIQANSIQTYMDDHVRVKWLESNGSLIYAAHIPHHGDFTLNLACNVRLDLVQV